MRMFWSWRVGGVVGAGGGAGGWVGARFSSPFSADACLWEKQHWLYRITTRPPLTTSSITYICTYVCMYIFHYHIWRTYMQKYVCMYLRKYVHWETVQGLTQKEPHLPSRSCYRQVTACYGLNLGQLRPLVWANIPHCGGDEGGGEKRITDSLSLWIPLNRDTSTPQTLWNVHHLFLLMKTLSPKMWCIQLRNDLLSACTWGSTYQSESLTVYWGRIQQVWGLRGMSQTEGEQSGRRGSVWGWERRTQTQ